MLMNGTDKFQFIKQYIYAPFPVSSLNLRTLMKLFRKARPSQRGGLASYCPQMRTARFVVELPKNRECEDFLAKAKPYPERSEGVNLVGHTTKKPLLSAKTREVLAFD